MTAANSRKTATAAEALGEKIPLSFAGVDFLLDPSTEWSYDALEAYEDGRITAFLRSILGDEQHAAYKATKPKAAGVGDFVRAIQSALGIAGN